MMLKYDLDVFPLRESDEFPLLHHGLTYLAL